MYRKACLYECLEKYNPAKNCKNMYRALSFEIEIVFLLKIFVLHVFKFLLYPRYI